MTGRLEGKVAFITGAARGQGRAHAVRLAEEGADIIAIDICSNIETVTAYDLATEAELAETVALVEATGRRIVAKKADVRDIDALTQAVERGVEELGRLDTVVANAGIFSHALESHNYDEQAWTDVIDVNQTGVWHTVKAAMPHMLATGEGGSLILISSRPAARAGQPGQLHRGQARRGRVDEGAGQRVRAVRHPGQHHPPERDRDRDGAERDLVPDLPAGSREADPRGRAARVRRHEPVQAPFIDSVHVSHAVVCLASDESLYVSGAQLPVDAAAAIA